MEKETEKILRNIGLTKNESSLYLAIIKLGRTNVSSITKATGIHRRNVYDSLSTLLDKGLIFQIVGEKEGYYGGVEPNKLLELIQSKEISLAKIMPELKEKYQAQKVRETAVIYKGVEGFKDYLRDILEAGQDVYCLGAKGGWNYKKLGKFADWFETERVKKKVNVQNLFDHEMKNIVNKETPYAKYGQCRFLPEGFSTNSAIDVFGDKAVTFTGLYTERFDDNVTLFVMQSRELAESYKTWFKFMWDFCEK